MFKPNPPLCFLFMYSFFSRFGQLSEKCITPYIKGFYHVMEAGRTIVPDIQMTPDIFGPF